MSDLLERLKALREGGAPAADAPDPAAPGAPPAEVAAAALGGEVVAGPAGPVVRRRVRRALDAPHGDAPLGDGRLHPWLRRWAARDPAPDPAREPAAGAAGREGGA
ncbi:MAG: hypothetical protein RI554_06695, partial [Trueperaceae bacterium]|nr:hypothetical protein [Trueperaceae bacterium]